MHGMCKHLLAGHWLAHSTTECTWVYNLQLGNLYICTLIGTCNTKLEWLVFISHDHYKTVFHYCNAAIKVSC